MHPQEQQALIRRALALLAAGDTERGEPASSPVSRYLDPARFEREVQRIFRQHPLALCPSGAAPNPGDSLALDVAGLPLLLVRGEAEQGAQGGRGPVRAFVNACRHRGTRLQAGPASGQRNLVCPYHSWTYGLDGALRGRPHGRDFAHAPPADCALAPVPAAEALGFVWAIPRLAAPASATLDIDARLGRFAADLRHFGYDHWVPFHQREFANAANWKLPFEGNLETYHFQYAHQGTIASLFHDNLLVADHDGAHQRIFLPKRGIETLRGLPPGAWDVGPHSNIIYFFFPATFILHEGDHANMFTVLPEAVDRSRVRAAMLVPEPPRTDKAAGRWRKNVDLFWSALDEDFALGVSAQSTLASGANAALRLGATECCSARFHADVEAPLAEAPLLARLHLGARECVLVFGGGGTAGVDGVDGPAPARLGLALGWQGLPASLFRHDPPTPGELEGAIEAVEDEVMPALARLPAGATLVTAEPAVRQIARLAGVPDAPRMVLDTDALERVFDRFSALVQGRPLSQDALPPGPAFAATLLVLRELMHHLKFASVTVEE